jgi:hypothetical protein
VAKNSASLIELLSRRRLTIERAAKRGSPDNALSGVERTEARTSSRHIATVQVSLKIGVLAHTLMKMRRWLSEHGCGQQAFRCVRVGSDALVTIDFDEDAAGLMEDFCRRFGGRELTPRGR